MTPSDRPPEETDSDDLLFDGGDIFASDDPLNESDIDDVLYAGPE